jgi:hypothetical protein
VFKEKESVKTKGAEEWQQEKGLRSFIENVRQLQHNGAKKQPVTINEGSLQINWARLLDNPTTTPRVVSNQTREVN